MSDLDARLVAEIARADRRGEEITAETLRLVEAELASARAQLEQRDPYKLRSLVGKWLRVRADGEDYARFIQLAADADHSSLLLRLFQGEEPLPRDEYPAARTPEGDALAESFENYHDQIAAMNDAAREAVGTKVPEDSKESVSADTPGEAGA